MKKLIVIITALLCSLLMAAQGNIAGFVLDKNEKPVAGAIVTLYGSEINAITDSKGEFKLSFSQGSILEVQTAAFDKMFYKVEDTKNVRIIMNFPSDMVDMGLHFYRNVNNSTAAISGVRSNELNQTSAQTLQNALFGKVLGLTALQNGQAPVLENASFGIRGLQSLNDNDVVILVDGVERKINFISPDEVESVSILKDGAALAMHGYKAQNGIISIRTKRGAYNTRSVKVSYEHAFKQPVRLPQLANAATYAMAMNEALRNDGRPELYSAGEIKHFQDGDMPQFFPNVDWVNESFRNKGDANKYNIAFRGGSDKMRYFTMVDLISDKGFLKNTETNKDYSTQLAHSKMNVRTNLDIDISKTTALQVNLMGVLGEYNRPTRSNGTIYDAIYTLPSAAYPIKTYDGLWGGNATWPTDNPVAGIQATGFTRSLFRSLNADVTLDQKLDFLVKGLKATAQLSYDNSLEYWDFQTADYNYASDKLNIVTGDTTRYTGGAKKDLTFSHSYGLQFFRMNSSAALSYENSFGLNSIYTTLLAGYEHYVGRGQNTTINRQNFSWLANYSYDNKYIADLVLNLSGSNRLPASARYNLAPTVSGAWVVSREDFMKDLTWLNFLKLRASAGINYSDYTPSWNLTLQAFSTGSSYPLTKDHVWLGANSETRLPMSVVLAERSKRMNIGVDMLIFNGLSVTADIYKQRRDNQFVGQSGRISSVLGMTASYKNAGIVDSKGFELGLDWNKKMGELEINAGAKFSYSTSEIIEMYESPVAYSYLARTGKPVGQLFGLEAIGFFADQADIDNSPAQLFSNVKPGDVKYKNQNDDNVIDQNDVVAIGKNSQLPEMYFSFNVGAEYKSIGFNAMFQGVGGYSAMPMTKAMYKPLIDNATISEHYYQNRWTPETTASALYPRLTTEQNDNNYQNSTLWLKDASFLKLRHCELYYKLPQSVIKYAKMSEMKLYVRAMDLILFDKIKQFDPEVIGIQYPTDRSLHLGVNIIF